MFALRSCTGSQVPIWCNHIGVFSHTLVPAIFVPVLYTALSFPTCFK